MIIIIIIIIILIISRSSFAASFLLSKTYILKTPGFGNETYKLPLNDLKIENINLTYIQYLVFVKYMNVPKIATFMSDNSQIKLTNLTEINNIISKNTISYNQAIGINSGTNSGIGQFYPPTDFQKSRTLLIIKIIDILAKMYCSNSKLNLDTDSKKFISNCGINDIYTDLERFYYLKKSEILSKDPLSLDYNTYTAIWHALKNRHSELSDRLASNIYKTL